ncbi:MAG: outer membrane receptor protein involved in Fe transport, partial [Oceanicoccus sp.]
MREHLINWGNNIFKYSKLFWLIKTAVIVVAITTLTAPAFAKGGPNLAMEEIIVTARKTEENLQTIPISLDAVTSTEIQEKGINDISDVAKLSASLIFDVGLQPNDTRPVIRGVSSTRGRANVATLIDDVDITSEALTTGGGGISANLRLMDLERVEIVKGPQSVLYGRSAFTGAV